MGGGGADVVRISRSEPPASRSALFADIGREDAQTAGTIGFMARVLVQTTLPHSEPDSPTFVRQNGRLQFSTTANPEVGLPYGRYPRLLMVWLTTEAVLKKSPEILLSENLSQFMGELGPSMTGGGSGTINRFRDQVKRLFSTTISVTHDLETDPQWHDSGFRIATETHLWWNPEHPSRIATWNSHVELSAEFFKAITERTVPIDLRVPQAPKSSLALDIYAWLTYRSSYLEKPCRISWQSLALQFGSHYSDLRDFRRKLLAAIEQVLDVYPLARVRVVRGGLMLMPARPHVLPALQRCRAASDAK